MRAALMHAFSQPLQVEEVQDPRVPEDGAVVEVRATGVCRSDWHGWMGHDPAITLPHVPHPQQNGTVTRSPAAKPRTSGPTAATTPASS